MLKILSVEKNSLAEIAGFREGDMLLSINGNDIRDRLDYQFYTSDETLNIKVKRLNNIHSLRIGKNYDTDIGIDVPDLKVRACGNKCIFCFIDQNPPGLRKSLYFHDEDYRFSFMFGHFITLTNIRKADLERIAEQHLSPLYISVHATDLTVRKQIFRIKKDDHLFDKLEYLSRNRIELHVQIVLIPGINDGLVLEKTINDLYHFRNSVKSVAIVPVGLTKHRVGLPKLHPVNSDLAEEIIIKTKYWNRNYFNVGGEHFVYLSDEFYLIANRNLPGRSQYGQFYQIENGVGLLRNSLDNFRKQVRKFPDSISNRKHIRFITGTLAKSAIEKFISSRLNEIENLFVEVVPIVNDFFGETVTVSGLLTGKDIIEQTLHLPKCDVICLPPRCINYDGYLLDNMKPEDIENALGAPVRICDEDYLGILNG